MSAYLDSILSCLFVAVCYFLFWFEYLFVLLLLFPDVRCPLAFTGDRRLYG